MCGPYGHGYYVAETDEILSEYMTKNAHAEFRTPMTLAVMSPGYDMAKAPLGPDFHTVNPIPFGIIPDTGEVVVQQRAQRGPPGSWVWAQFCAMIDGPPDELATRAKRRIRATWDIAVPTVAELCRWIEAHYGKRGDGGEWIWRAPRLLCRSAQRRFFPVWLATDQGYVNGHDDPAPHLMAEGQDHRRICEALRRGGANAFWANAGREDRKAAGERVLAGAGVN